MRHLISSMVIVLAIILVLPATTFAQPGFDGHGRGRMMEKLDLTKDQETKIEALRNDHLKKMIDLRAELEKARIEMKQLLSKGEYTRAEYLNMTAKISKIHESLQNSRANHQMDVYDLLTKEQKAKWNEFRANRPGKGGMGFRGDCGNCDGRGKGYHRGGGRGPKGGGKGFRDGRCLDR